MPHFVRNPAVRRSDWNVVMVIFGTEGQGLKQFIGLGAAFLLSALIGLEREVYDVAVVVIVAMTPLCPSNL